MRVAGGFLRRSVFVIGSIILLSGVRNPATAQQTQDTIAAGYIPDILLRGLQWRDVGPMRGGRTYAVAGVPSEPDIFYMGSVGGGVWKTENAGRTWFPISDQGIPIGSIGAIAVAPSDPNVIYVGTGEPDIRSQHSYGIGVFKSIDAGKTWSSIGLKDSSQIGRIVVDPRNPNLVYVAALGHVYDANPTRGVYRSSDGGAHWTKVLFDAQRPNDVGAIDLAIDPIHPRTLYASLWSTRRPPWSVYAPTNLPGGGLYKSTDGGDKWHKLSGGLPTDDFVGKIGIAVAPSKPKRLWAVVDDLGSPIAKPLRQSGPSQPQSEPQRQTSGGVYISDDAGATWKLVNSEQRLWGRGWYFEAVAVDPSNPDRAYVSNTGTFETRDGGKTFVPVKGSPGGDDDHQMWINPRDDNRMVLSTDQGTVVSVDGAQTWSTWYNQPTAQIYHVAASTDWPWHLYGAQQDSGSVGVDTWSPFGLLDYRDWEPTCLAGESNTVVPDPNPKHARILYGNGRVCDQSLNVALPSGQLPAPDPKDPDRHTWTLPEVFSPSDQTLYYSNQFVFRSRDRGRTWEKISPDLTRLNPSVPSNLDPATAKDIDQPMTDRFGVVYTISPSPLDAKTVWVGTDDGLVQVTTDDGASWNDVTPPALSAWSKISQVEAGHFDKETAYVSVDRHRLADIHPYIYRTHDGGKSWTEVSQGIPEGAFVNAVKEDPKRKGLLYAATELRLYVSFDDGDHWQPLQLNMPVTSVRDVVVHGDDLAIATYGRGFWVLDDMAPLRQIAAEGQKIAASNVYLFTPGESFAIRQGGINGTPIPHEEPQEFNPPSGVVAYYFLKQSANTPLKIELVDSVGKISVCLASDTPLKPIDTEAINVQAIWEVQPPPPSNRAGTHRVSLDIRPTRSGAGGLGQPAIPPTMDSCHSAAPPAQDAPSRDQTTRAPRAEAGLQPGNYTVRLTVDGQTFTQPVTVKPDPRNIPTDAESTAFSPNNNNH